jgi:hypothetical protein
MIGSTARVALVAVALVLVPSAFASSTPRVMLTSTSPARVRGSGFQAREAVAVSVTRGTAKLRLTVETDGAGAFLARFKRNLGGNACAVTAVVAVGARGDRAAWKTAPMACGAPPADPGR